MVEVSCQEGSVTVLTGVIVEVSGHKENVTVLTSVIINVEGNVTVLT